MKKCKTWKQTISFALALAFAAGNLYANSGDILTGSKLLTASAEETAAADQAAVTTGEQAEKSETAEETEKTEETAQKKAVRTIMLYAVGSDLETGSAACTHNIKQILSSDFGNSEDVRFVIMTGGSNEWHTPSELLYDPATGTSPESISAEYNQIWEAKSTGAAENPGKMVLVDGDGLSGDGENAKPSTEELMNDPETLKAFINYSVENFPAEQYDLILWDHGGGPNSGFGLDEHDPTSATMQFSGLVDAFSDNDVVKDGGKFDFINFDACEMGTLELTLAFSPYMNYYIASPEYEPGKGQDYTGWLAMLGENPAADTMEVGKKIVDDIIAFYGPEDSPGYGQDATLTVINVDKFLNSGILEACQAMEEVMNNQLQEPNAKGDYTFYDEFYAFDASIHYANNQGDSSYYDLGNMALLLKKNIVNLFSGDTEFPYTESSNKIMDVLKENPEAIYARATDEVITKEQVIFTDQNDNVKYENLRSTGLYLSMVSPKSLDKTYSYLKEMNKVVSMMPEGKEQDTLLGHMANVRDLLLVEQSSALIKDMLDSGMEKDKINFETIAGYLNSADEEDPALTAQRDNVKYLIEHTEGGIEATQSWLDPIIKQQVSEAVNTDDITVQVLEGKNLKQLYIATENIPKRTIDSIGLEYTAEIPAVEEFWATFDKPHWRPYFDTSITLGSRNAVISFDLDTSIEDVHQAVADWFNNPSSSFEIDTVEDKWYAIHDAEGNYHLASFKEEDGICSVSAYLLNESGEKQFVSLDFVDGKISEISIFDVNFSTCQKIVPSDLVGDLELYPAILSIYGGPYKLLVPCSDTSFTLNAANADKISLEFTDVANIPDIKDIDGDGKAITESLVMTDMYNNKYDLSDKVANPAGTLVNIEDVTVEPAIYDGTEKKPVVKMDGKVLKEGTDYTVTNLSDSKTFKEVGKYEILIFGAGEYGGFTKVEFEIKEAADYATLDGFARMAKIDYEKKTGVAVTPEAELKEDGNVVVTLKNADGKVVDTYTLNVKTGIGTCADGDEVNLPQTGVTSWNTAMAVGSAFALVAAGLWLTVRSSRRKQDEE